MSDLVERQDAMAAMDRLLAESATGHGRVAVVHAPPGGGKTQFLHSVLQRIGLSDALVLRATALRHERTAPFGVASQLFQTHRISRPDQDEFGSSLAAMAQAAGDRAAAAARTAAALHRIGGRLADLAQHRPLVIGIDGLHDVDEPSLRFLASILPRLRDTRALVVLTDDARRRPVDPALHAELLQQPNAYRIDLPLLTRTGIDRVLTDRLGAARAAELGPSFAALCGGNPMILQALIGNYHADRRPPWGYGRALVGCLSRGEPELRAVARALAVLGAHTSPQRLARLSGLSAETCAGALRTLDTAGLLDGGAFRHPSAADDVLDDMPADERSALRLRAAEQLSSEGAPAITVAHHLVVSANADSPWAGDVLVDAARHALAAHQPRAAADYLELAQRTPADERSQASLRAWLNRLRWQLQPPCTAHSLTRLVADAEAGHTTPGDLMDLLWTLAWHGDQETAEKLLAAARSRPDRRDDTGAAALASVPVWLAGLFATRPEGDAGHPAPATGPAHADDLPRAPWQTAAALTGALLRGDAAHVADHAEGVLTTAGPAYRSLWNGEEALLALLGLVYVDALERAAGWCGHLLAEAERLRTPLWQAAFTAVRAEVALREGSLPDAAAIAAEALDLLPRGSWGTMLGLPVSTLVLAKVRMGRYDEAGALLSEPMPEAVLRTRYGAHLLHARGQHRLVTGNPRAALGDFLRCGELLRRWSAHGIVPVPWRVAAAEASVQVGNHRQADRLLRDEAGRLPALGPRARGLSLRVLAAASPATDRPGLLEQAVAALKECGDQFEVARALAELSRAYQEVEDQGNARRAARMAWPLARASAAEPLSSEIAPAAGTATANAKRGGDGSKADRGRPQPLTARETHVAALAGRGYTNQEIAAQLLITPSTVEQHLTRVFRKLKVKGRQQLP
ncbi:LuxR family transcriptional regulator [Actinoplanes teichomyceticus]|uniref:LuxR C-terminal-related transcriptional regulator n=1 Tax=Actinoplanes teichomyceticus TaxID=1867 RepID=UPI0021CCD742|nr:LuxR family transcriptional regulator [Actinoplanes teichomyceticus]